MRWVYILKCENDYFYVGETKRLYRRFWEHEGGNGSVNTYVNKPEEIVAIYKVNVVSNFIEYNNYVNDYLNQVIGYKYIKGFILNRLKEWENNSDEKNGYYKNDNLLAETNITECLMMNNKNNWTQIRGGKYTRFDANYKYPDNVCMKDLPLCDCGLPCDIKKNKEKNFLYFRCAKKNMWIKLKEYFDIFEEPCSFYMEYTKDKQIRLESQERKKQCKELFKKSFWLKNIEIEINDDEDYGKNGCVKCNECKLKNLLSFYDEKIRLCFNCFISKNDELSKEYGSDGKCLIKL